MLCDGIGRKSLANQKTVAGDSFSPGEKAGMRAGVKTNLMGAEDFLATDEIRIFLSRSDTGN